MEEPRTDVGIDVGETLAAQAAGAWLIDVRTEREFAAGHALGSTNVPLAWIREAIARIADRQVVTICAHGARSSQAAQTLRSLGADATYLAGGLTAWQRAGERLFADRKKGILI